MGSESCGRRAVGDISAASANVLRHISSSESVSWNGDCRFRGGNNAHLAGSNICTYAPASNKLYVDADFSRALFRWILSLAIAMAVSGSGLSVPGGILVTRLENSGWKLEDAGVSSEGRSWEVLEVMSFGSWKVPLDAQHAEGPDSSW
jgi:hypothetical protein